MILLHAKLLIIFDLRKYFAIFSPHPRRSPPHGPQKRSAQSARLSVTLGFMPWGKNTAMR